MALLEGFLLKMLLNEYENKYWANNQLVIGTDEAGRGPICGPEVVACCILPINYQNEEINDSKKLTAKKREVLFKQIIKDAIYFDFRIVSNKEIDESNIYQTTKMAMKQLLDKCDMQAINLTDAMPISDTRKETISLIKGDAKSISIAAASILAKVLRDHIMWGYDHLYPEYELIKHKGYPTARHIELINKYGLKDFYRMSYGPCKKVNEIKLL